MTVHQVENPVSTLPATDGEPPAVTLRAVSKVYGRGPTAALAVDRVDLQVAHGEFVCLVGACGCGKSTLLSMVSGLEPVTAGQVDVAGGHRPALMFQDAALLP